MPERETPEDWPELARELGQRVRRLREDRKREERKRGGDVRFTQEGLAHEARVSRNHVQNIENARSNARDEGGQRKVGNPGLATLLAISRALDVELLDLLPDALLPEAIRHRPWNEQSQ